MTGSYRGSIPIKAILVDQEEERSISHAIQRKEYHIWKKHLLPQSRSTKSRKPTSHQSSAPCSPSEGSPPAAPSTLIGEIGSRLDRLSPIPPFSNQPTNEDNRAKPYRHFAKSSINLLPNVWIIFLGPGLGIECVGVGC